MPRPSKGARLQYRADRNVFIIRDGEHRVSTGTGERGEAERALAAYIATKDRPAGPSDADKMTVARALDIYVNERAPHVADAACGFRFI